MPQPLAKDRNTAFLKAQNELLSHGITATADMGTTLDEWMTYRRMGDAGNLRVRIMSYGGGVEDSVRIGGTGPTQWLYNNKLRLVGVKLYGDGALGSRGAWLKQPYADAPWQTGLGFMSDDVIRNLMSRAAMDKYQVAVHAIGDRANAQVLDAIDELAETYKGDRRWRIEHAQIVDPADLSRFGRHGIIASMQPVHETSDRTMAEARLGPARLTGFMPEHDVEEWGDPGSAQTIRSKPRSLCRLGRGDHPTGARRPALWRVAAAGDRYPRTGVARLHHGRRLCRLR